MSVEVCPCLYRHGKVSMHFKSRGGLSVRVDGTEIAGSPDATKYDEILQELLQAEDLNDNVKASLAEISDAACGSLYSEFVMISP